MNTTFEFTPAELERIQTSLISETNRLKKATSKARKERNYRLEAILQNATVAYMRLTSKITIAVNKNGIEHCLELLNK